MKLFDPDSFLDVAITAVQAKEIAQVGDSVLRKSSFVLYGTYENGEYKNFTSNQKPGDTHCLLAMAPKRLKVHNILHKS